MICLDINQGCAGFLVGLFQSFMLLDQPAIKKVVLINADVISRKVSKRDRNSDPLIGDGASVTIIERSTSETELLGSIKMDGSSAEALIIPAGGLKIPSTAKTKEYTEDPAGNFRSLEHLVMKGDDVFNFVQKEVPVMIADLLKRANLAVNDIDYYMFHQPNKFMLDKLADKIGVDRAKMPSNIVGTLGNSSGVSIPAAITYNLSEVLLNEPKRICVAGFGVGLTWASLLITLNKLKFCKLIDF
jgi:3-oxoacyl-[acyl-carrier-protein] synthase-3